MVRRNMCSKLQSRSLRMGFGTVALGNIDNPGDD